MSTPPHSTLQVRSTVSDDGEVEITLVETPIPVPGEDQIIIAVEAAPINPADIMVLLAGAAPADLRFAERGGYPVVSGTLSPAAARAASGRSGRSLPVGLEGAGTVVAAGAAARHLVGTRVAALTNALGMYGRHCTVNATDCMILPEGQPARIGADAFCNPLTALAIVETLRLTGQTALVHTAAASSLGRMLVRICQEDGIPLVNIVRRREQAEVLKAMGATHVCDSSAESFRQDLAEALEATGAMVAFDAIGGGTLASDLLAAMEAAAVARSGMFHPYGTAEEKRVYVYGRLDPSPIAIGKGAYGMVWGVDGWAMPPILERAGAERREAVARRIADNLTTTFATDYAAEISLAQLLRPEALFDYCRQATGAKYLLNPQLPLD